MMEKENTVKNKFMSIIRSNVRSLTMVIALLAIWVVFSITTEGIFISTRNLVNLSRQTSIIAILSLGMVLVIVSGNIDLSVGSVMGMLGCIGAALQVWNGMATPWVILIMLAIGAIVGAWHGFWVAYRKVPAFITTLGGYMAFKGVMLGISKGQAITPLQEDFKMIGQGYLPAQIGWIIAAIAIVLIGTSMIRSRRSKKSFGFPLRTVWQDVLILLVAALGVVAVVAIMNDYEGIPFPVLILIVLTAAFSYLTKKTTFGRKIYAIGGNPEAAMLSGINRKKIVFSVYVIIGILCGIGGAVLTARLNSATAQAGQMAEMDTIAACVIGGTSMMGGVGSVGGAIVGALIMASLDNGMSLMNTEYFWQYIVKGFILIIAVWFDIATKKEG